MTVILSDLIMAASILLIGFLFYISKGKAANFLSGYNTRSKEWRKKHDEEKMCRCYGKIMMIMGLPFIVGAIIDYFFEGIGLISAWIIWVVLLIYLVAVRARMER